MFVALFKVVVVGSFNISIRCFWCFNFGRLGFLSVSVVHSYSYVTGIFSGRFRFALPNKSLFTRGRFVCGRVVLFDSFGSASSIFTMALIQWACLLFSIIFVTTSRGCW